MFHLPRNHKCLAPEKAFRFKQNLNIEYLLWKNSKFKVQKYVYSFNNVSDCNNIYILKDYKQN